MDQSSNPQYIEQKLDLILHRLSELKAQGEKLMAQLSDDYKALAKQIDDATNTVAAKITALLAKIKNGMSDQEVADTKAAFQAEIDKLTALGKDPQNPIPASLKKP